MKIGDYDFQGGGVCPEQYEIYKDKKLMAYFRLRYGEISVIDLEGFTEDNWGLDNNIEICLYYYKDSWEGKFLSDKQRQMYLKWVVKKLDNYFYLKHNPKRKYKKRQKEYCDFKNNNFWTKSLIANLMEDFEQNTRILGSCLNGNDKTQKQKGSKKI